MAKWIAKANDDVLSFCTCDVSLASVPAQLDCPWCGCGYLLTCTFCRKAFTFGQVVIIDKSARELVAEDAARGRYKPTPEEIEADADAMTALLDEFEDGEIVVYLDGVFLNASETDVRLKGIYAHHALDLLPHVQARGDRKVLLNLLGDVGYWVERERPDRE